MDSKLNSEAYISKIDKHKIYDLLFDFPEQIIWGIKIFTEEEIELASHTNLQNIVICGMGGSAISGDILKDCSRDELEIPIFVNREHNIPKFVNEKTLLIAISYSGNTYETLEMLEEGISRGATVAGITSGGKMKSMLENLSKPIFIVPPGLPPRHALGFLFTILFLIISKIFQLDNLKRLDNLADFLRNKRSGFIIDNIHGNLPKSIASEMFNALPFLYSDSRYFSAVIKRWKTQMNENAKHLVAYDLFPELTHNEIVGWEFPPDIHTVVLLLRDIKEDYNVAQHINTTKKLFNANELIEIITEGEDLLERIFYLIYLGDFTSFYLAILKGIDPYEIKSIDKLKEELKLKLKEEEK